MHGQTIINVNRKTIERKQERVEKDAIDENDGDKKTIGVDMDDSV